MALKQVAYPKKSGSDDAKEIPIYAAKNAQPTKSRGMTMKLQTRQERELQLNGPHKITITIEPGMHVRAGSGLSRAFSAPNLGIFAMRASSRLSSKLMPQASREERGSTTDPARRWG